MTTIATTMPRDAAPGLLAEIGRFGRFSVLGFSLILPIAGAATVSSQVSAAQLAALLAVAFAFHIFGYVSNDVIDLPLDRTEPLRAGSPLVRGLVSPRAAFAIAMIPVPLAAAVHLIAGGNPAAAAVLMIGMGFGWIYNAHGKKIAVPLVSDAVQAMAWGSLALYGALTMRAPLTAAFGLLAATVFFYVLLVNGLHGGLRDIGNDARHGAKTTAILLGARATDDGRLLVPRVLKIHGLMLHLLILTAGVLAVVERWPAAAILLTIAHVFLLILARKALREAADRVAVVRAGFAHLFLSIGVVFLPFALFGNRAAAATIIAVYAVPVAVLAIRMTRRRILPGVL
jgi:4-hydroxybenzoate polyprenyltransferase